jgi:DMSO/TMAO reductase YedYZ heme-binding membrane subunit
LKEVTVFRQARVLSPILFIVMMDELVTSIKGEKRRLDMKTLILADEVLIWEKDK